MGLQDWAETAEVGTESLVTVQQRRSFGIVDI